MFDLIARHISSEFYLVFDNDFFYYIIKCAK